MRIYEELFIISPDAPEEEIDPFVDQLKAHDHGAGGTIDKDEQMGRAQARLSRREA